jgi:adhesin/invasin
VIATVSLASAQTPVVNAGGVVNDGSYDKTGVAPGSIVAIFGTPLASSVQLASSIPLSTSLGNVTSVTFNGIPAPLYFVGPMQINAQMPWNVLPAGTNSGTATVVVTLNNGASSAPQMVPIVASLPGIFTVNQSGTGQGIATDNNDGAMAAPAGSIMGLVTHPISISSGHPLIVWCTGLGAVTPAIANGVATGTQKLSNSNVTPTILIGGVPAKFISSVLSPQFVSENQVAVFPDPTTPTGNAVTLQIQVPGASGTYTSSDKVTIAVAP